jgi:SAM-dependent methyltransferase
MLIRMRADDRYNIEDIVDTFQNRFNSWLDKNMPYSARENGYLRMHFVGSGMELDKLESARRRLYTKKKPVFLELGCGAGWNTLAAAMMGCEAYGVDINKKQVDKGNQLIQEFKDEGLIDKNLKARLFHGNFMTMSVLEKERAEAVERFLEYFPDLNREQAVAAFNNVWASSLEYASPKDKILYFGNEIAADIHKFELPSLMTRRICELYDIGNHVSADWNIWAYDYISEHGRNSKESKELVKKTWDDDKIRGKIFISREKAFRDSNERIRFLESSDNYLFNPYDGLGKDVYSIMGKKFNDFDIIYTYVWGPEDGPIREMLQHEHSSHFVWFDYRYGLVATGDNRKKLRKVCCDY